MHWQRQASSFFSQLKFEFAKRALMSLTICPDLSLVSNTIPKNTYHIISESNLVRKVAALFAPYHPLHREMSFAAFFLATRKGQCLHDITGATAPNVVIYTAAYAYKCYLRLEIAIKHCVYSYLHLAASPSLHVRQYKISWPTKKSLSRS